ncbi:MAG TPA: NAD-glutamate dehydrogenase [Gammaproteobacteria bacterium]|nr:NAD-glutamate dehydrogenase [Gammaproteobacteria bacterium]
MAGQQDSGRQEIIKNLRADIKNKVSTPDRALLDTFAQRYYVNCSVEDLTKRSLDDLFGALVSHWRFIYERKPGTSKVRVFNPVLEKDGWESTHTIIEVSHDDIPFLVDSIRMEVNRNGLQIHYAIHFGGLRVIRDGEDRITDILPTGALDPNASSEAPIYLEIDRQSDADSMEALRANIERVLDDAQVSVIDWRKMVNKVEESLLELEQNPPPLDPAEIAESKDFLRWLISNHFTFLGSRDYKLIGNETNRALQIIRGTGLGVLRDESTSTISRNYADLPPQARKLALSKNILIIAKTNTQSTVHRAAYTDYIGVKRFNEKGELIGERRFVGLYTSTAYHSSPRYIPFLRHKVAKVIQEFHYPPDSHNGKEVVHILETLPRDDLFQATHEELLELTQGILYLQERKQIRLFVRKDSYSRYFSCLVYVPREIFDTDLVMNMQDILMNAFQGRESSYTTYFSDSVLARIHYLIRVSSKNHIDYDVTKIEKELVHIAHSWSDELKIQLVRQFGEAEGLRYYVRYRKAFPTSYTECYLPGAALDDIKKIEALSSENPMEMLFYKSGRTSLQLKLFHNEHTVPLSDVLPTLENMGLRIIGERPHEIVFKDGRIAWISDFDMIHVSQREIDVDEIKDNFQDAFTNIWFQNAEDDGFNRLVLDAQLSWHETAVLRAYTKYLRQTGFTFSQSYVEQALINNQDIARDLVALFKLRFSPEYADHSRPETSVLVAKIEQMLENVTSLDEDRIIRRILEVILATIRTNYFQTTQDGKFKSYISFKLDPSAISDLPLPRPMYEIFVYSPRVEGVHLRGGKVARGGLRWSDRREDFRTEVLGLMKAQQVKNSVIVPVGAKGGFFPKALPEGDRDAIMKEGIDCYSTFIRGMLDITDNIRNGKVVPPVDVVRYDEEDPYLVVAADKGTATFSDIANSISKEYDFWLDDAFASGGSAGYDHKKMGITARGAWESVKRHFRELGINPGATDFTVVGIGDMSGDVFGNGMLMSNHIKLLAAYNHMHIFIDPDPDASISFEERKRLFNLPRSTWMDYNAELISKGGGVFSRSAKSVKITPEMKAAFGISEDYLVPNDLIRAVLTASVDLIWNGGIGTFVKASEETHAEVGDRTNDAIRINGNELKARVVGEGGNLGMTQRGRIEYALNGGVLYTDFIDNSAGVDCSDHEVNLKILLNKLMTENAMTLEERNSLLGKMTDEVADLVLRDNYEQTQMVSLESSVALQTMDLFRRYMSELEKKGRLNRELEFLPDEKSLLERKANGQGLTRPEVAVLISYCKMFLKQDILASDIPEDPWFVNYLTMAFPASLREKYLPQMKEHSLRREIIATQLGKYITDHMGVNFIERLQRETGASVAFIVRAYVVAESIYGVPELWKKIEALDLKINTAIQQKMMLQLYFLTRRATRWFLRNLKPAFNIQETIDHFRLPVEELIKQLPAVLSESDRELLDVETVSLTEQGVPSALAKRVASCNTLFTALDIVEAAIKNNLNITDMAETYYALGNYLELNWLRDQMNLYPMENQWDELARSGFRDDLDRAQRKLSVSVLLLKQKKAKQATIAERIETWLEKYALLIERWQNLVAEIKSSNNVGFVTYSVVLRELFDFAQAG